MGTHVTGLVDAEHGLISRRIFIGRCLKGVDSRSKRSPEFVSVDEQPDHAIVHMFRLGETNRPPD
jgi:hypothetical protein